MSVQQEPVKIIQMISVPVSFLSLAWAFTAFDTDDSGGILEVRNVKQKVILFVNYLFLLSSRLIAITFFTITYKWWIISVLMLIVDTIFKDSSCWVHIIESALYFCLHWLRDDMSPTIRLLKRSRRRGKSL